MSVHRDVDAELRFHFGARIEELVAQGLSREDAHARAVAEFGDVNTVRADLQAIDRRVARQRSRLERFDALWQDLRYAARSLRKTPAVSLTIIVTLALGLGANAAMFSLLDVIFLRPPAGVADPGALRRVWAEHRFREGTEFWPGFDYAGYAIIERSVADRADATLYLAPRPRKIGRGEQAPVAAVSAAPASYFPLLGIRPQLGRFYGPDEDRLEVATPVAVISDAFWQRQFGGSPDVIGRAIVLANERFTIIGVAPAGFHGVELDATDVWLPISASLGPNPSAWWKNSNLNGFQILLRLHPGVREGEVAARTTAVLRNQEPGRRARLDSLSVASLGSIVFARGPGAIEATTAVAIRLAGVAIIVLLIAGANVVNLLLARALERRREIAVRIALGVSRLRLMRMLVTESVLLAIVATVAALGAAVWGGALLRHLLMPEVHFAESSLHWRVLVFALGAAIVAGVLAGLVPAVQSASPDLTSSLKAGVREGGGHRSRMRSALVVCQASLSVVLLVGAVLFVRSLHNVKGHDIGFSVDQLGFASVSYDQRDSARNVTIPVRLRSLERRLAAIPGVQRVAYTSIRPKWGFGFQAYLPDVDTAGRRMPTPIVIGVSPSYFAAVGMRLLRGTTFSRDVGPASPFAVIPNQAMADAIWPGQDPLGHCIYFRTERQSRIDPRTTPCSRVIGVVETALLNSIGETPEPQFYFSLDHPPFPARGATSIIVRASPEQLASVQRPVTDLLRAEFPGAIPQWTTMTAVMEPEYRPWRLGATLFTLFGVLALCVAGIGIYSTVSFAVTQRRHEFGVRVALGAQTADVVRQVLGDGLRTVVIGIVLGILMALAAGRLVASLLYGVAPSDPVTLGLVAVVLLATAALAALVPAWRAAGADPVSALRAE